MRPGVEGMLVSAYNGLSLPNKECIDLLGLFDEQDFGDMQDEPAVSSVHEVKARTLASRGKRNSSKQRRISFV